MSIRSSSDPRRRAWNSELFLEASLFALALALFFFTSALERATGPGAAILVCAFCLFAAVLAFGHARRARGPGLELVAAGRRAEWIASGVVLAYFALGPLLPSVWSPLAGEAATREAFSPDVTWWRLTLSFGVGFLLLLALLSWLFAIGAPRAEDELERGTLAAPGSDDGVAPTRAGLFRCVVSALLTFHLALTTLAVHELAPTGG